MDKTMEKKLEFYESHTLDEDSIITHECSGCGKCCNRKLVGAFPVTGADLFTIARHLGMPVFEVATKYCYGYIGNTSGVPVFCLESDDEGNCVFLKDGKCSVHEAKPATCALYPFGRMYKSRIGDEEPGEAIYFMQPSAPCENPGITALPFKDWKAKFRLDEGEEAARAWNSLTITGSQIAGMIPFPKGRREYIPKKNLLTDFLYDFDIEKNYVKQVNERLAPFRGKQGQELLGAFADFSLVRASSQL